MSDWCIYVCFFFFSSARAKIIPAAKQEAAEGTVGNPNLVADPVIAFFFTNNAGQD